MTTLIAVYNSEGLVGRCDARCYEAAHPECDCVCGGLNHGAGYSQAVDNTAAYADAMIEEYARKNQLQEYEAEIGRGNALQPSLLNLLEVKYALG